MVAERFHSIIERFLSWAQAEPDVRAALVVGSQARTETLADEWSDLDVVVVHTDPDRLIDSTEWFQTFGEVLLSMVESTAVGGGRERRVLYTDGRDVDFAVFPAAAMPFVVARPEAMGVLGRGFHVLLDKDRQLARIDATALSSTAVSAAGPTEAEFEALVADFWYHVLWTAKKIRRGETWTAKMACDGYLKRLLLRLIEWKTVEDGRGAEVWHSGRFLDSWAGPAVAAALPRTFAQYDLGDLTRALGETGRLFSGLARELAASRKWKYPLDSETQVTALADRVLGRRPT